MKEIASAIRDKFFATPVPTNPGITLACLSAGNHLLAFLKPYGLETSLFRRPEVELRPADRERLRATIAEIIAAADSLPPLPVTESLRAKALTDLRKYQQALGVA